MPNQSKNVLHAAVDTLRDCEELEIDDALALAETAIRVLKTLADEHEPATVGKLDTVASKVARLKTDVLHLQANHLRHCHIPEAGRELDATVEATETAATRIMESAEAILAADPSDSDAYLETINAQVMAIFEACAFQDITGQRIAKARENLKSIETRVSRFAEAVGARDSAAPASEEEATRARRKKDLILNGPAHDGEGVSQSEIDSLLEG